MQFGLQTAVMVKDPTLRVSIAPHRIEIDTASWPRTVTSRLPRWDHQGPGQETARAIIRWSDSIARRGNKPWLQWVPMRLPIEWPRKQRAKYMATANLGGLSHGQAPLPQEAGNRSQSERNDGVDRGMDKRHSAEKTRVPQGTKGRGRRSCQGTIGCWQGRRYPSCLGRRRQRGRFCSS